MLPSKTAIDPALYRKLKECFHEQVALQKLQQQFVENCKSRMISNQQKIQETWHAIKEQTGVDLERVVWNPHPSEPAIIPVQMVIATEPTFPVANQ